MPFAVKGEAGVAMKENDMSVQEAKEGDMRVWWVRNPPDTGIRFPVATPEAAIAKLDQLANADLQDASIWGNAGGLEVYEAGEWCEWYNNDGEDIRDYEERLADE